MVVSVLDPVDVVDVLLFHGLRQLYIEQTLRHHHHHHHHVVIIIIIIVSQHYYLSH